MIPKWLGENHTLEEDEDEEEEEEEEKRLGVV